MIIQDSRSSESFKKMWSLMLSTLPEGITSFHATYILDMLYLIEENYDPLCKGQNIELKTLVSNPNTSFDIQEWAQIYAPMILEKICSRFHFQQLQHQQLQQSSFDLILRKDIKEGEDIKNRSKDDEDKDAADQTKLNIEAQETEEGTSFIEAA